MSMRALVVVGFVSLAAFVGCASTVSDASNVNDEGDAQSTSSALRRTDPCAVVRCMAGTHCVAKGQRASCVSDSNAECTTDADCRLFDNYCDGCSCQALASTETAPKCTGTIVQCFVQPCFNQTAVCSFGQCVAQ